MSAYFTSVAPYHVLSYGTLLGSTFFHSFINGPAMYKTLQRPDFSAVQQKIFPIYFGLQTAIPAFLALTYPGNTLTGVSNGISGLMSPSARWDSLLPIATMFTTGLVNLVFLLPVVLKVMKERREQVKRDGKEWDTQGPHSEEMKALNKRFGMLHGVSTLLNLTTLVGAVAYGLSLGNRITPIVEKL